MTTTTTQPTPAPKPDAQPVPAAIPARPKLGDPASAWADYNAAISAAGIRFQDKLDADYQERCRVSREGFAAARAGYDCYGRSLAKGAK
jgi:hypothetical protein